MTVSLNWFSMTQAEANATGRGPYPRQGDVAFAAGGKDATWGKMPVRNGSYR
jgi:hypothetical protein